MKDYIFYQPNLKLDKSYYADGKKEIELLTAEIKTADNNLKPNLENLSKKIITLKNLQPLLPEIFKPTVKTLYNTIEFIFIQIDSDVLPKKDIYEHIPEEDIPDDNEVNESDIIIKKPEKDTDTKTKDYDFLFSQDIPSVDIKVIEKDKSELMNKYYSGALLQLLDDYINKLNKAILSYYENMFSVIEDTKNNNTDETYNPYKNDFSYIEKLYTYSTKDIENNNLKHLSDYIIKNQIILDQKKRMMEKLFNDKQSLIKIKNCEIAKELYLRYLKEGNRENNSFPDVLSNMILKESQLHYEKKIDDSLYELYKYLNSSVIILNECFNIYTRTSNIKKILLDEENIKL